MICSNLARLLDKLEYAAEIIVTRSSALIASRFRSWIDSSFLLLNGTVKTIHHYQRRCTAVVEEYGRSWLQGHERSSFCSSVFFAGRIIVIRKQITVEILVTRSMTRITATSFMLGVLERV